MKYKNLRIIKISKMLLLLLKTKLILAFQKGNIFYRFLRALCFVKVKDVIKDCWVTIYVQTLQNKWPWMHFGLFLLLFTYLFFSWNWIISEFHEIFFSWKFFLFFANLTLPKTWFSLSRIFPPRYSADNQWRDVLFF